MVQQPGDEDAMDGNDYRAWYFSVLSRVHCFVFKLGTKRKRYKKLSPKNVEGSSEEHSCDLNGNERVKKLKNTSREKGGKEEFNTEQYLRNDKTFVAEGGLDCNEMTLELPKYLTENERLHLIRTRFQRRNAVQVNEPDKFRKQLFDYVTLKNLLRYTNLSIPVRTGELIT